MNVTFIAPFKGYAIGDCADIHPERAEWLIDRKYAVVTAIETTKTYPQPASRKKK
jgi:hypothetical protein